METKTIWEDTGKDCPFCGGEVLQRTDQLPDASVSIYYQCSHCGAQWTLGWSLLRRGSRVSFNQPANNNKQELQPQRELPVWAWISLAAVAAFILLRTGLIAYLRLLIVPVMLCLFIYFVFKLGREQAWW